MKALQKLIRHNTHHLEKRSFDAEIGFDAEKRSFDAEVSAPVFRCRNWFNYIISYVNASHIQYGFCVATQAIRYYLNVAWDVSQDDLRPCCIAD
jgi:hypothetical protein